LKSENEFVIISNRLVRLTERECCNSTCGHVVFDIGNFFNAKDIRYCDSELGTTHTSQRLRIILNFLLSLDTFHVSERWTRRSGPIRGGKRLFATEHGKAIQSTETKGARLMENASFMYPTFRAMTAIELSPNGRVLLL